MMRHKASRTALGHFRDSISKEGHHAIMARNIRHRFESRTARLKLVVRKKPYSGPALGGGVTLLYRRNAGNGTWVVKAPDGKRGYWTSGAIGRSVSPRPTTMPRPMDAKS
jgi:hypothetical protein